MISRKNRINRIGNGYKAFSLITKMRIKRMKTQARKIKRMNRMKMNSITFNLIIKAIPNRNSKILLNKIFNNHPKIL